MRYQVGDRVLVRADLEPSPRIYCMQDDPSSANTVVSEMMQFAGTIVTIDYCGLQYQIKEVGVWGWTDEMFEGLADECAINAIDVSDLI